MASSTPHLSAIVLNLRATMPHHVAQHMGRAAQQLALDIIRQQSESLSASLHGPGKEVKPYVVSGLLHGDAIPVIGAVRMGDSAWVRLGGLNAEVCAALEAFAAHPPDRIEFNHVTWALESVATLPAQHLWAGETTYGRLLNAPRTEEQASLSLRFAAPTGFHSKSLNVPLPIPALVWGSLFHRWNALAPLPLPDALIDFIDQFVPISRYQTCTQILSFKQGARQIGFVGEATYTILKRNAGLERYHPALAEALMVQHAALRRGLAILADFAFYSGVGIKTTTGMGMVRRIKTPHQESTLVMCE